MNMFAVISISSLFLLVLWTPHAYSSYIDKGAGVCAESQTPPPGDITADHIHEYTTVWAEGVFNLTGCQGYCNAIGNICLGVSYSELDHFENCLLHGANNAADFTSDLNIQATISYDATSGDATTGTFVSNSNYDSAIRPTPTYVCYQKDLSASAFGDPHVVSIYGCRIEAPVLTDKDEESAVVLSCGQESLSIRYKRSWNSHISQVDIYRDGGKERTRYPWAMLRRPRHETVCGNRVEFHRYRLGISIHMNHVSNTNFTGLFADRSCQDL